MKSDPQTPVIVVTADVRPTDGHLRHSSVETYLNAVVTGIGGIPLIVPSLPGRIDFDALFTRIDGVIVTGSPSNVHPPLYGAEPSEAAEPYDHQRDAFTLPLIRAAVERGVPLLAICRGIQEFNVAMGGTLSPEIAKLPGRHEHHLDADTNDDRYAIRQDVFLAEGGCLAGIFGSDRIRVNSVHYQGIERLAPGLVIEATAPDGTVEGVSVPDAPGFAVGVQWHPEYWVRTDP
ncbi:MAG: gamma-glutamyl-gamma-aminobutyrate hydrolase family protein, partial [Bauldia sp.]|nr:gamma-glutamyl-gamma-aminobutyrate hydrolase family protein [Bauldia sp.]